MKKIKYALPIILATAMLASCAMASSTSGRAAGDFMEEMAVMPAAPAYEGKAAPNVESVEDSAGGSAFEGSNQTTERIVIKNANLSIAVEEPADSLEIITEMAKKMGGFVVSSNLYKTTTSSGYEYPNANITIRVPSDKLEEALELIKAEVEDPDVDILSEEISGQDVTSEVTDLESRLRNLQAAEIQLLEIMETAIYAEDVIQIFRELTNVREEIEVIQGQIKYYRESAKLSAISVFLQAKEALAPITIGGWQPGLEAQKALQALVEGGKYIVNALIWLVIFALPILAAIFLPIYLIFRFVRKKKMSKEINNTKEKKK
jgi:hypothetical protein